MPSLLVFGAHPDDCELTTGGLSALYAERGWRVCWVSLTNGDAGHQTLGGANLARIRRGEARAAAAAIGAESIVLDNHDGELLPTLDRRRDVIGIIRDFGPDLILSPRPNDYHPDHRYTAQVVQDAAYMVTVPNICAFHERMSVDPVIAYVSDRFLKPVPLDPDVVIDIGSTISKKIDALDKHASQLYDWLAWHDGGEPPAGPEARRAWLAARYDARFRADADRFRQQFIAKYGPERGTAVVYGEAFETSEYGSPLTDDKRAELFPF